MNSIVEPITVLPSKEELDFGINKIRSMMADKLEDLIPATE
jgi:hypothetical protein